MKRWLAAILAVALFATAFVFFKPSPAREPWPFTLYFTCDIRGRLVPCGCFTGQMGGLTRVATLIGLGQSPQCLKVDIGDALGGTEDFEQIEHRYILDAFAKLGYDAVNLGHREAALSAAQLREIKAKAPVPILAANLLDKTNGRPIFDTHRIVTRGRWKVALVGVMDSHLAADSLGEGLVLEPVESTLGRLLPALKKEADFIVLLAFANEAALKSLARDFYELDVVLGGNVSQPAQQLIRENRSLILYTTNQSRAVGRLDLTLEPPSKMTAQSGEVMLVHDKVPEVDAIRALATAYRAEIRHARLAIDNPESLQAGMIPGVKNAASFVGSERCVSCHANAAKVWAGSRHSHAFAPLVNNHADADPNCIGCHAIGFGTASGYRREMEGAKLVHVGCESCHGPGSQHVEQRGAGVETAGRLRTVGAGDCQKCHHGEFSRPFVWDEFWPAIRHGK
ncbi:MAG: cytochrome [Chthoniobacteraceae bacterium]|nr:cytochrome [Chthoniobacteraceae bacterium]